MLADLVIAALGQQGMLWSSSPISTELESVMVDWLVDALGLPATWKTTSSGGGVLTSTASDATHLAVVVARQAAGDLPVDTLVAYGSQQAHSSIEKGARVAGYRHIRTVAVDADYAMDPVAFEVAVLADIEAGLRPAFVCSTVGTTGRGGSVRELPNRPAARGIRAAGSRLRSTSEPPEVGPPCGPHQNTKILESGASREPIGQWCSVAAQVLASNTGRGQLGEEGVEVVHVGSLRCLAIQFWIVTDVISLDSYTVPRLG